MALHCSQVPSAQEHCNRAIGIKKILGISAWLGRRRLAHIWLTSGSQLTLIHNVTAKQHPQNDPQAQVDSICSITPRPPFNFNCPAQSLPKLVGRGQMDHAPSQQLAGPSNLMQMTTFAVSLMPEAPVDNEHGEEEAYQVVVPLQHYSQAGNDAEPQYLRSPSQHSTILSVSTARSDSGMTTSSKDLKISKACR